MPREFESKTYDNIFSEIKSSIENKQLQGQLPTNKRITDFSEGSIAGALLRGIAATISNYWETLKQLTDSFYISTATGDKLKARLLDFNYVPAAGTKSTGTVFAVRPAGVTFSSPIPVGTQLISASPSTTLRVTGSQGSFDQTSNIASIKLNVEALNNGALTIPAGKLLTSSIYPQIQFYVGSTASQDLSSFTGNAISGGSSSESDEEARRGFQAYIQNIGYGTISIIENYLKSVSGVKSVIVHDNSRVINNVIEGNHPGSIVVEVTPETWEAGDLPAKVKESVENRIQEKKPAGIRYDIKLPPVFALDCVVKIKTSKALTDESVTNALAAAQTTVKNYFSNLSIGQTIYLSALEATVFTAAVSDRGVSIEVLYPNDYSDVALRGKPAYTGSGGNRVVTLPAGKIILLNSLNVSAEN